MPKIIEPKIPFHLADLEFLRAMCENFERGLNGDRYPDGWKNIFWGPETKTEYAAKVLRHLHEFIKTKNPVAQRQHAAAIACNANILWHHIKDRNDEPKKD